MKRMVIIFRSTGNPECFEEYKSTVNKCIDDPNIKGFGFQLIRKDVQIREIKYHKVNY
jgi:hypothetical protein